MTAAGTIPTVSVVVPCFNQARYLAAAIASARDQTHPPLECIVVDDGSTDSSAAVATSAGARLIRQRNSGVSGARNTGLDAACGEFIVFLDADDVLLPEALAIEADALRRIENAAAVVTRCEAMAEDGTPLPVAHHPIDPSNLYRDWLSRNFVWTPGAAMFRRAALQEIGGFAEDLGPAADYAVYLRLAREGRIAFVDGCVVRYRQHAASMSRDPVLMLRATLEALHRESVEGPPWAAVEIRRGRRTWCAWYGEQIVHDLRAHWRRRTWGAKQSAAMWMLLRNCPAVAVQHLLRKTRRSVTSALRAGAALPRASR